jgi:hypothetical protein
LSAALAFGVEPDPTQMIAGSSTYFEKGSRVVTVGYCGDKTGMCIDKVDQKLN